MIKSFITQKTGELIRKLREEKELPLRKIASQLGIDTSFFSKIERSERNATKAQIHKLEEIFEVEKDFLMIPYLSERIYFELLEEDCAAKVLKVAEERVKYEKKKVKDKCRTN
jgi:transcriptional regulator with XRE-family HTH domain